MIEESKKQYAVIYARVSPTTEVNTPEGMAKSIVNQTEKCKTEIEKDGRIFLREYKDQYISGKNEDWMLDFQRMKEDSVKGEFSWVYVLRGDRLGRSQQDGVNISEDFRKSRVRIRREVTIDGKIRKVLDTVELPHPIYIKSVEERNSTDTPDGKMFGVIVSSFAERNRERIIENTERGRIRLKREIEDWKAGKGQKPKKLFGRKPVVIDWDYVKYLRSQRMSFSIITKKLRENNDNLKSLAVSTLVRRYKSEVGEPDKLRI